MSVTLDELLSLVGRLDDALGFDTPRERFRRFLLERVTDVPTARALIEECQRSVGEQHHRALQDLVVVTGRLLKFEITFGTYERSADGIKMNGQWRSPGLLDVVLEIKTDQTTSATMEGMAQAMTAGAELEPRIGLCVIARQYAAHGKIDRALAAVTPDVDIRVVSIRSLLALAAQVSTDRLAHAEVVRLLRSGVALDFVIDLLDRPAPNGQSSTSTAEPAQSAPSAQSVPEPPEPEFWVATITGNEASTPEQLLASVIADRHVLAISHAGRLPSFLGAPGDWVCFFVPRKGIVGHAQLASIIEDGAKVVRDAGRFGCVYRLAHVTLYERRPIIQALRNDRPFSVPPADLALAGPCLAPITRQDFLGLMAYRDGATNFEGLKSATA
jgi:hypothetical protein